MKEIALLYPYIIPNDESLKRSLLMFDAVSSIVPEGGKPVSDSLRELSDEGLWQPAYANVLETDAYLAEIEEVLTSFADDWRVRFDGWYPPPRDLTRLFLGKVNPKVEEQLLALHLAKRANRRSYVAVHEEVANMILSVTAVHLARAECSVDTRLTPTTDSPIDLRHAFAPVHSRSASWDCWRLVLDGILPTPDETVPLAEVIKFRRRHERDLITFRTMIRDEILHIMSSSDPHDEVRSARARLDAGSLAIHSAMKGRRWRVGVASLFVLVGTAGMATIAPSSVPWVFSGAGAGVVTAVEKWSTRTRSSKHETLGYLVQAQRHFT